MSTSALKSILSLLTFVILKFSGCYKAVQCYWLWAVRFCCNWWGWTTETSTAWEIVYFYSFWKGKKGRIIDGLLTYILMRTPVQKLMLHLHCSICIKHSLCIFSALVSIFFQRKWRFHDCSIPFTEFHDGSRYISVMYPLWQDFQKDIVRAAEGWVSIGNKHIEVGMYLCGSCQLSLVNSVSLGFLHSKRKLHCYFVLFTFFSHSRAIG